MLLQYGCVNLNLLHVRKFSRQAVYEGPNYAYTKFKIIVQAIYTPGSQQDSWPTTPTYDNANYLNVPYVPPGSNPRAQGGNSRFLPLVPVGAPAFSLPSGQPSIRSGVPAVVSDVALRHALMQPRQQLSFSVGGLISVYSPLRGFNVDAMNGPKPLFCHVVEIQGSRTFVVEYGIETDVNECATELPVAGLPQVPGYEVEALPQAPRWGNAGAWPFFRVKMLFSLENAGTVGEDGCIFTLEDRL
jgi:hypothetical protein